jgi:hypothetical protein
MLGFLVIPGFEPSCLSLPFTEVPALAVSSNSSEIQCISLAVEV